VLITTTLTLSAEAEIAEALNEGELGLEEEPVAKLFAQFLRVAQRLLLRMESEDGSRGRTARLWRGRCLPGSRSGCG
jgi:hypothetical protein